MNQIQIDICQRVLSKLNDRPVYKLFLGTTDFPCIAPMDHPTNFLNIQTKMQRGLYESTEIFIDEVKRFLQSFIDHKDQNPLKAAAAQQLLIDFQNELERSNPLKKGLSLRLNLLTADFYDYIKTLPNTDILPLNERQGQPNSLVFRTPPEEITTKQLIREIKFLRSPDLLVRVAAFIYKQQPEALQLGNELSIKFQFMKPETLSSLKLFVRSLLYQAAKGKLDPFKASIGTSKPVILEEL